jgi:preprotein translocase subunit YajC
MLQAFLLLAQQADPKQAEPQMPIWATFVPLIIIFVLFYFLLILPERRREQKRREELNTRLKKNDKVITSSGIIAYVANIKDEEVTLRIDDNTNARLTVLKSSIARIMTGDEQARDAAGKAADTNIKAGSSQK